MADADDPLSRPDRTSTLEAGLHAVAAPIAELITGRHRRGAASAVVEANARLTSTTGIVLLVLLAAEGVTILSIRRLLPLHYFIGLLLIPPVVLKLASTGWRFAHYYLGSRDYRVAGPPAPVLRLLGPLVVISTIVVLATGVELWLFGFRFGDGWLTAHKASFVIWLGAMAIHVIGHLERAPALALRDLVNRPRLAGQTTRQAWIAGSLVMGAVLAASIFVVQSPFVVPFDR
ncbi:MAG TPA: hypothetical protein VFA70_03050 [Dehalococcoidia bacterium]|nr:hypothetical protein [Dehalococcoidia bacterium]